jgi:CheY-specific phosphatase CheX
MKKTLDVKLINPFLQSSVEIFKMMAFLDLSVGKPELADLIFSNEVFVVQAGLTGNIKARFYLFLRRKRLENSQQYDGWNASC